MPTPALIALDPGTAKIGLCLFAPDGRVLGRGVVPVEELHATLAPYPGIPLACGTGTGTLDLPTGHPVRWIDETGSTQEGRALWRKAHPLLALLEIFGADPASDGYAAEVIGRRALAAGWPAAAAE